MDTKRPKSLVYIDVAIEKVAVKLFKCSLPWHEEVWGQIVKFRSLYFLMKSTSSEFFSRIFPCSPVSKPVTVLLWLLVLSLRHFVLLSFRLKPRGRVSELSWFLHIRLGNVHCPSCWKPCWSVLDIFSPSWLSFLTISGSSSESSTEDTLITKP